jgi:hypothetical protein
MASSINADWDISYFLHESKRSRASHSAKSTTRLYASSMVYNLLVEFLDDLGPFLQ